MRKVNEDRRTRKTKAAIERAFLELIEKKDISKITIRDITDKADTNRSTFYTHYEDIYDLLDSIGDKVIDEMLSLQLRSDALKTVAAGGHVDMSETLNYIYSHQAVLRVLFHSDKSSKFIERLSHVIKTSILGEIDINMLRHPDPVYYDLVLRFFVNGIAAVLAEWVNNQKAFSPDKINTLIEEVVHAGLKEFVGKEI